MTLQGDDQITCLNFLPILVILFSQNRRCSFVYNYRMLSHLKEYSGIFDIWPHFRLPQSCGSIHRDRFQLI